MNLNEEELIKYQQDQERQEALEHRDVLLAIAEVLKTPEGIKLFEYLFKNLGVGELPDQGMSDNELHDYLGYLRSGNQIYKLACEADYKTSGEMLAKIERKKYEDKYHRYRIEQGFINAGTSDS